MFDIPEADSDPVRTMVVYVAFQQADIIRKLIVTHDHEDLVQNGDCAVWKDIWVRLQPRHPAITCWDMGVSYARKYLDHMWASAKLAECFERGDVPDDSMYANIVR